MMSEVVFMCMCQDLNLRIVSQPTVLNVSANFMMATNVNKRMSSKCPTNVQIMVSTLHGQKEIS